MGLDKRLIKFGSVTLIDRMCKILELVTNEKPTIIGDNLINVAPSNYRLLKDYVPNKGPLGGLLSALGDCPTEWALVTAVDMPYLNSAELQMLSSDQIDYNNVDVLTLSSDGEPEPLAALYRVSCVEFWYDCLRKNKLSLRDNIRLLKWQFIPVNPTILRNINRPEDIKKDDFPS